ncbi:N-acyl-phosphatidylethanolamine-hydrolyzing phospholipase D-like [Patiria miniata]|uniref:Metallo-beta-lactamase domain-containing protein n=1 Tax=Patiria miniata TaxID=46514 RepID=A0A914AY40_PATMI|nr:N-acyl-phosphatidylethanolamine-hydrolyzing phospholipase D-like [Patiria miniata]
MKIEKSSTKVRFGTLDPRKVEDVTKSVLEHGRYRNPRSWDTWRQPSFITAIKLMFTRSQNGLPSKQELERTLPMNVTNGTVIGSPPDSGIKVTWFGHASLLVQFDGVSILTDPIFSSFCGPASLVGYKRYRPAPCTVEELPKVHAVVISHSHFDHLDLPTVKQLNRKFKSDLRWFVPSGMKSWFTRAGVEDVVELIWWEDTCNYIQLGRDTSTRVRFFFTPAQHWSMRNGIDTNKSLWGSWSILGPNNRFFFAGDTGYCSNVFKEIGQKFGPFDVAAIPIGAYKPKALLSPQHVDPSEAVQIHSDIQARHSVGIHWGTFELGKEHYLAPREDLKKALEKARLDGHNIDFFTLQHGETMLLADKKTGNREGGGESN